MVITVPEAGGGYSSGQAAECHRGRDAINHPKSRTDDGLGQGEAHTWRVGVGEPGHHPVLGEVRLVLAFFFRDASSQGREAPRKGLRQTARQEQRAREGFKTQKGVC